MFRTYLGCCAKSKWELEAARDKWEHFVKLAPKLAAKAKEVRRVQLFVGVHGPQSPLQAFCSLGVPPARLSPNAHILGISSKTSFKFFTEWAHGLPDHIVICIVAQVPNWIRAAASIEEKKGPCPERYVPDCIAVACEAS